MAVPIIAGEAETGRSLSSICFRIGSLMALVGVSLGIYMDASEDRSLITVHVHLDLLGWVGMFLFGLFYKTHPSAVSCVSAVQVVFSAIGYVLMTGGLAIMTLTSQSGFSFLAAIGSLFVWLGIAIFAYIVARTA